MDTSDLFPLIEDLDSNIDDLEEALKPLFDTSLSDTASKLSQLDQAKLYVLATYAIESLIFSHVRLTGADGKAHPVFKELARVKQYFEKIDAAEHPVKKRENLSLNKPAAARFIQAGLSGNEKFDKQREEQKSRQVEGARVKLEQLSTKSKADGVEDENSSSSSSEEESESHAQEEKRTLKEKKDKRGKKKRKSDAAVDLPTKSSAMHANGQDLKSKGKKSKKSSLLRSGG